MPKDEQCMSVLFEYVGSFKTWTKQDVVTLKLVFIRGDDYDHTEDCSSSSFFSKECVFLCIPVVSSPKMTTNIKLALYSTFLGHIAQRCEC